MRQAQLRADAAYRLVDARRTLRQIESQQVLFDKGLGERTGERERV